MGDKIDELQIDLREAARWVCRPDEILGAIGLINRLGKACFIQGLSNERIQTIVRSRGESILLSQTIELSLEEESAILSGKERSPSTANGPPLRCSRCNRLGHAANKCMDLNKLSPTSVRTVLSCFSCGREGHVARDCQRRLTYKSSVSRDADNMFGSVGRDTQYKGSVARDTDNVFVSVCRDTCCKDDVSRDTDNLSRSQGKGWIRSGNYRRELSSNPTTAHRLK